MTPERWSEIERVYHEARKRPPAEREGFVRAACAEDEQLGGEVLSLLACREEAGRFIEAPALEVAARAEAAVLSASEAGAPPDGDAAGRPFAAGPASPPPAAPFPRRHRWWVWCCVLPLLVAAASVYWVILTGPEPAGWVLLRTARQPGAREVQSVAPGSASAVAGFEEGDLVSASDLAGFLSVRRPGIEHPFVVVRGGARKALTLVLGRKGWTYWGSPAGRSALLDILIAALYLALAGVLLFRRPDDRAARWGALLMAQFGFETLMLPLQAHQLRLVPEAVVALRALPGPLTLVAVGALAVSLMAPAGAFGFCAVFPRPLPLKPAAWRWLAIAASGTIFIQIDLFWLPVYSSRQTPWFVRLGTIAMIPVGVGYLAWAVALLVRNYRRVEGRNERRRIRIVALGFSLTLCAFALSIFLAMPWGPLDEIRAGWTGSAFGLVNTCLFAAAPLCTAYAILRHRVFDIRVIVRLGVRYAVARGLLLSIVPALGLVLALDVLTNRDQPLAAIIRERGALYGALGAMALVLHLKRKAWMDALDRRFFREHHDARRLLRAIADDLRHAGGVGAAARLVIGRVEGALHPESVALMIRRPDQPVFHPAAALHSSLPPISRLDPFVAAARATNQPVECSQRSGSRLPSPGAAATPRVSPPARIEWLFPVSLGGSGPEAFLLVGPKRSEEPYSGEDRELLQAVTSSLALLLERPAASNAATGFTECPACGACGDSGRARCEADETPLVKSPYARWLAGRYRLDRRLGRGGMGTVYLAFDGTLEREVAVKVVRTELLASPDAIGRFRREARTAALLAHPNVVTVYDFGVADDDRAYLVMERLHGRTLREELRERGALGIARARDILHGVAAGVSLAHRHRLLHRDLKPENIFLSRTEGGEVAKVLDFGLVKALEPGQSAASAQTVAGSLLGTVGYMSPEQLRGDPPDVRWDVWALAVVAYEMSTGIHPFVSHARPGGLDPAAGVARLTALQAPVLRAEAHAFFERAFAVDPALRPGSVQDLVAEFDRAVQPGARPG